MLGKSGCPKRTPSDLVDDLRILVAALMNHHRIISCSRRIFHEKFQWISSRWRILLQENWRNHENQWSSNKFPDRYTECSHFGALRNINKSYEVYGIIECHASASVREHPESHWVLVSVPHPVRPGVVLDFQRIPCILVREIWVSVDSSTIDDARKHDQY